MSRIASRYECWAAFEDSWMEVKLLRGISERDRTLLKVARGFDLQVF